MSTDSDLLVYGVNKLWIKKTINKEEKGAWVLYEREKILEDLQLSVDQFIDMCLILGCDYSNDISFNKIGQKTAYALIQKYGS